MPDKKEDAAPPGKDLGDLESDATVERILDRVGGTEETVEAQAPPKEAGKTEEPQERKEQEAPPAEEESRVEAIVGPEEPTEAEEAPPEPTEAPEEVGEEEPWVYRAGRREHTFEGTAVGEDGVFFPNRALPRLQSLVASGHARHQERLQLESAVTQERTMREAAEARNKALFDALDERITASGDDVEALAESLKKDWPRIKSEAQIQSAKAEAALERRRADGIQVTAEQEDFEARMPEYVDQVVSQIRSVPEYQDLSEERIHGRISAVAPQAITRAQRDGRDGQTGQEWKQGDVIVNWDLLDAQLGDELRSFSRQQTAAESAIEKTQRQTGAQAKVPPTVPAAGSTPTGGETRKRAQTREEADAHLDKLYAKLDRETR